MRKIRLEVSHRLGSKQALERIKKLLEGLKTKFSGQFTDLDEKWEENNGFFKVKVMGMNASGKLEVTENLVKIEVDIPTDSAFLVLIISATIRSQAEAVLK